MNDETKDDLLQDCNESFTAIAKAVGYAGFGSSFEPLWLPKLNRKELDQLATFLNYVWDEVRET